MENNSKSEGKTRRLDDEYFKKIAARAKEAPVGSDQDKTQIVGGYSGQIESSEDLSNNKTQIYRPKKAIVETETDYMIDPPAGWIVAIEGPGRGAVLTIGIGNNSVGRGEGPRITIPFDDNQISRGQSFSIVYDPKHRRYYLLPGSGKTLVYFDDQPVLERMTLEYGMSFQVGQTRFRFISLCDENFDWT